jgi:hypothetical protein
MKSNFHIEQFVNEAEKFMAKWDEQMVDVWTGCTGFAMQPDGSIRTIGGKHERMTHREYRERFPDEADQ